MRLSKNLWCLALLSFLCADLALAATVKRPLTVNKDIGDQYYLSWTGSAPVVTADDLILMADTATANVYGVDPFYFRMDNNRQATTGPWRSFPGAKVPEKVCVAVRMAGDADATTSDVFLQQSTTKSGTHRKVGGGITAATVVSVATTTTVETAAVNFVPWQYFKVVVDPTTATDSIEVTGVWVWSCDD